MKTLTRFGAHLGWACVVLSIVGASNWCAAEPHPSLPTPGTTHGLGVNIHFTDARPGEMDMLADGGFGWVRMDFVWGATERQRGEYDFRAYERLLESLEAKKLRVLFILDYSNKLYEKERSVATEEGRQAFARWAAAAAKHFQGRGVLWEIWNEPNIKNFWEPEPNLEHYTALAKATSHAIRAAAPGEAVIGPATSTVDFKFLEGCFHAGLLNEWDAVSVHPYRQKAPETAVEDYAKLRELIDKYAPEGKSIPIISGEWGYSATWKNYDADRQGKYLPRQWLVNMWQQIPVSIWYDWHDDGDDPHEPEHHFGTVTFEYHQGRRLVYDPKPAYLAAKTLASQLQGYEFEKRIATERPEDYALLFRKGDDLRLAVWTTGEARDVALPASEGEFEAVSHTGEQRDPLTARDGVVAVPATEAPMYITPKSGNPKLIDAPAAK
jgi:hypothetical protein